MTTRFQAAADAMRARLALFRKTAEQAREMGETVIELDVRTLWEPSDQAAIDAFDSAKAELVAGTPLPMDTVPVFCTPHVLVISSTEGHYGDYSVHPWCPGECGS